MEAMEAMDASHHMLPGGAGSAAAADSEGAGGRGGGGGKHAESEGKGVWTDPKMLASHEHALLLQAWLCCIACTCA